MTTIDPWAYPHIIDAILSEVDLKTQAAFSATCTVNRAYVGTKVQQISLRGGPDPAAPQFAAAFSRISEPFIPSAVEVLDLAGDFYSAASRPSVAQEYSDLFTKLRIIRRFSAPAAPITRGSGYVALGTGGNVHTVVDYADIGDWPTSSKFNLIACWTRHVLHLRWGENKNLEATRMSFTMAKARISSVIVLYPPADTDPDVIERHVLALLPMAHERCTLVGPAKLKHRLKGWKYLAYDDWWAELGDDKHLVGEWVDMPAQMLRVSWIPVEDLTDVAEKHVRGEGEGVYGELEEASGVAQGARSVMDLA